MAVSLPNPATAMVTVGALVLLQVCCLIVYRLFFHPLAKVPGFKLAAVTHLYEFWYDGIQEGQYYLKIEAAHERYGPIVRINPREVHIKDPEYFDKLYNLSMKLNKDPYYYRFTSAVTSAFATDSHILHRQRRKGFDRFLISSAIRDLESLVRKSVLKLCARIEEHRGGGKPVILSSALRSLATDVISQYVLPQGFDLLSSRDFGEDYNNVNRKFSGLTSYQRHFPFVIPMVMKIPTSLLKLTASPGMIQMLDFQGHNKAQAEAIVSSPSKPNDSSVLHGIFNSDLSANDKTATRIFAEALTLVGAGSETTGSALEHVFFHVLSDPVIKERLKAELEAAAKTGDLMTNATLSNLEYLNACIKEGLRIGNEVSGRLARYDPINAITYRKYALPPRTVVSMSMRDMHLSPSCYPSPHTYDPERWLNSTSRKKAEQFFAPFGKGARSCVGRELAMLEMSMTTANLMHRFDLSLWKTKREDVEMAHDFFSPFRRDDSRGCQVVVS